MPAPRVQVEAARPSAPVAAEAGSASPWPAAGAKEDARTGDGPPLGVHHLHDDRPRQSTARQGPLAAARDHLHRRGPGPGAGGAS